MYVPVVGIERLTGRQSKVRGEGQRGLLDLMYEVPTPCPSSDIFDPLQVPSIVLLYHPRAPGTLLL